MRDLLLFSFHAPQGNEARRCFGPVPHTFTYVCRAWTETICGGGCGCKGSRVVESTPVEWRALVRSTLKIFRLNSLLLLLHREARSVLLPLPQYHTPWQQRPAEASSRRFLCVSTHYRLEAIPLRRYPLLASPVAAATLILPFLPHCPCRTISTHRGPLTAGSPPSTHESNTTADSEPPYTHPVSRPCRTTRPEHGTIKASLASRASRAKNPRQPTREVSQRGGDILDEDTSQRGGDIRDEDTAHSKKRTTENGKDILFIGIKYAVRLKR